MVATLLNKAERLFQTDMRYFIKNGGWLLMGQILLAVLGFVLTIAFANLLSQQEYGVYKFIIATGGLLAALRLNGLRLAVTQAVARGAYGTARDALFLAARWNTLVIVASCAVAGYYLFQDNYILAIGILAIGSYNAIVGALRVYRGYLSGTEQFHIVTIHELVTTALATGSIFLALLYTDNVLVLVAAGIILPFLAIAWFTWNTLRKIDRAAPSSQKSLTFGKHMSAQNFLLHIGGHIDKVILFQWLGSVELAIYAFSLLLPDHVGGLFKSVMGIVVPKFAKKEQIDLRRSVKRKLLQLTIFMILPVIGYIMVAPYLFAWLFPVYVDSVWYSQLLIVGLLGLPASYLFIAYFDTLHRTRTLYKAKISASIIKILLILVGTWTLGLFGAVLAHVMARVATVAILGYYYYSEKSA